MASVYDLKPKFQNLLRPMTRGLAALGITANHVTLAACALSLSVGGILWVAPSDAVLLFIFPATLFIRMALNAIDGMLAREHGQASRFGAVLNELCDVISDIGLYAGFGSIVGISGVALATVIAMAGLVEFQGVLAQALVGKRAYQGPFGKSDRALFFGLASIAVGLGLSTAWVNGALIVAVILSIRTLVNRVKAAGI